MKLNKSQKGFGLIEILLTVVVVSLVGFIIWTFYQKQADKQNGSESNSSQAQQEQVPEINNSQDLEKAEESLQSTEIDKQLDTSEIDESLSE